MRSDRHPHDFLVGLNDLVAQGGGRLDRELRLRHGAYGERLHQILYGDDPSAALGHTTVDAAADTDAAAAGGTAKANSGSTTSTPAIVVDPAVGQSADPAHDDVGAWASFVQTTDPADQAVIDSIEQSPQNPL